MRQHVIHSSAPTITDHFCGCGGSSEGAKAAGAEIVVAANHWDLAIKSHNANHPDALHIRTDISTSDPRRWPRTRIMIASPECTWHSLSRGRKTPHYTEDLFGNKMVDPAEERSRMTMWDVCRFAEVHRYEAIVVENVVDVRRWPLFDSWLMAMRALDYEHKCVYFNSMFAYPCPQSRDRIYVVFWKRGNREPDLDLRPKAPCPSCGKVVGAVQVWKMRGKGKKARLATWGKYGARNQYYYQCPDCCVEIHPFYVPALAAIDWTLPAPRIGDRDKPLKPKTIERIKLGLERYKDRYLVLDTAYSDGERTVPVTGHAPTQTTRQTLALLTPLIGANRAHGVPRPISDAAQTVDTGNHLFLLDPSPFIAELHGTSTASGVEEALATVTVGGGHHGLTIPAPFLTAINRSAVQQRAVDEPMQTQTASLGEGLTIPPAFLTRHYSDKGDESHLSRGLGEPLGSITTADHHSLTLSPAFLLAQRGNWRPAGLDEALGTQIANGSQHALIVPPSFLTQYYGNGGSDAVEDPLATVPGTDRHALVKLPFIVGQYGDSAEGYARNPLRSVDEVLPTIPGMLVHRLAQPGPTPDIEDCGFRMLEPHEIKLAMAFGPEYVIYGNKREQVKQAGNAVVPPVMKMLIERVMAALD